jgi:hypothetical protein
MPFRVTDDEVREIVEVDSSLTDLSPFIRPANTLVTEVCVPAGYDNDRLALIELWLSAHFCQIFDPRFSFQKADVVAAKFDQKLDLALNQTVYGQQAMLLDTKGGLALLNKRIASGIGFAIGVTWLGKLEKDWPCGL